MKIVKETNYISQCLVSKHYFKILIQSDSKVSGQAIYELTVKKVWQWSLNNYTILLQ